MPVSSPRLLRVLLPAFILTAAACERQPTAPVSASEPSRTTSTTYSVSISGPTQVWEQSDIQLTATASPGGSYHYQWYEKWCNAGGAPNDCVTQYYPTFAGQDLTTVTERVYTLDKYVDYKVEIRASAGGPLLAVDTHRTWGPYTLNGGGCGTGPC